MGFPADIKLDPICREIYEKYSSYQPLGRYVVPVWVLDILLQNILSKVKSYWTSVPEKQIKRAFYFSHFAHSHKKRACGRAYFIHPSAVALHQAEQQMAPDCVIAALLHDTIEDVPFVTENEWIIKKEFGQEILDLVKGVTHVGNFINRPRWQADKFKNLILAAAKDLRIISIKLSDRLHNLKTLDFVSPEKQKRVAHETMRIYVPLARRFGSFRTKRELEDLAFKYTRPEEYEHTNRQLHRVLELHGENFNYLVRTIRTRMQDRNIDVEVNPRLKHIFSIYTRMKERRWRTEWTNHVWKVNIITKSVEDCYRCWSTIMDFWRPIPGSNKDYISNPKPNGYQALHLKILAKKGFVLEVQIKTEEMHEVSELGITKKKVIKDMEKADFAIRKANDWIQIIIQAGQHIDDALRFFEEAISNLLSPTIRVYTPANDEIELPKDSTPVDFAYAIHTDLGNQCTMAILNMDYDVPLSYTLSDGQIVKIVTDKNAVPHAAWLEFVKTEKAKTNISRYLSREVPLIQAKLGEELLDHQLERFMTNSDLIARHRKFESFLRRYTYNNAQNFFIQIGKGRITAPQVISQLVATRILPRLDNKGMNVVKDWQERLFTSHAFKVGDPQDALSSLDSHCDPLYKQDIIGVLMPDGKIKVHSRLCSELLAKIRELRGRIFRLKWSNAYLYKERVTMWVFARSLPGIATNITSIFLRYGFNIRYMNMSEVIGGGKFILEAENLDFLDTIVEKLKDRPGVDKVLIDRKPDDEHGKDKDDEENHDDLPYPEDPK